MNPKLSILILTIPSRADKLKRLLDCLKTQQSSEIEIIVKENAAVADGGPTIGENRNAALADAIGDYVAFIDDDDMVDNLYVTEILKAIVTPGISPLPDPTKATPDNPQYEPAFMTKHPDVIGIKGHYTVGDSKPETFVHSMKWTEWFTKEGVHYRCPNHLNPVRRELALQAGYPPKNHGEDHDYSIALRPLLKTEVMIDKVLYYYLK